MADSVGDLSYRGYFGNTLSERGRWLVVAKQSWKTAFKKRGFWVASSFGAWYFIVLAAILYFVEQSVTMDPTGNGAERFYSQMVWKDQFLIGFTFAQLMCLVLVLIVGAGSIANDNRTNALLVYLSKPVSKLDYLFGKWMGVLVPLVVGLGLPLAFFYTYCLMNFRERGFLEQDPWLGPKLIAVVLFAAAYHSTLILGVSSLFNSGRVAGGAYAAVTFVTGFFSQLMLAVFFQSPPESSRPGIVSSGALHYLSVDGLVVGMSKIVLGTDGGNAFTVARGSRQVPIPPAWMIFGLMALAIALAWAVASWRVKAVEVVK
ncbi:MAG: ABC transporter permease subunit [Fimbriimonadaceae bacterium]|nr:ABC transporter permease subunit [Fimbriimonadaceae bacterium]QYK58445.1 MAG: ABC transporter permease subunit [Fimbriimonadaceae bacterium]